MTRQKRSTTLKEEFESIYTDISEVRETLWSGNYASGVAVDRLAANVQHLCRIIQEEFA